MSLLINCVVSLFNNTRLAGDLMSDLQYTTVQECIVFHFKIVSRPRARCLVVGGMAIPVVDLFPPAMVERHALDLRSTPICPYGQFFCVADLYPTTCKSVTHICCARPLLALQFSLFFRSYVIYP